MLKRKNNCEYCNDTLYASIEGAYLCFDYEDEHGFTENWDYIFRRAKYCPECGRKL